MDETKLQAESQDVQAEFEKLRFQLKVQERALALAVADVNARRLDAPHKFSDGYYAEAVKQLAAQGIAL